MAINKNHEFEELDGIKCGIVERNVLRDRVTFLKNILETNGYTVIVVPSPPPKAIPATTTKEGEDITPSGLVDTAAETFTVGVTDYTFNSINAIFGRLLKTKEGSVVTLAYWHQDEAVSHDDIPYCEENKT